MLWICGRQRIHSSGYQHLGTAKPEVAGGQAFGRRALDIAEDAIAEAAELLGVDDLEPVDFIIYSDTRLFREAMGPATRENVGGQAHPGIRTLFGLIEPRQIGSDWVEELVVHELAHLVFDEAVSNPYQYPPRWLNEGVAVYVSGGYDAGDRSRVQGAAGGGTIITGLADKDKAIPKGLFLAGDQLLLGFVDDKLIYAESFALVPEGS